MHGLYFTIQAWPFDNFTESWQNVAFPIITPPHLTVTKVILSKFQIMVVLCYSCGTPCKTRKGLENHLKSCPACLNELGISRSSNRAVQLGLSSVTTSSKVINHHLFRVKIDPKLAAKRPVEVMWQDENTFEPETSFPESPFKSLKSSAANSIRGTDLNSSIFIQLLWNKENPHDSWPTPFKWSTEEATRGITFCCSPSRHLL